MRHYLPLPAQAPASTELTLVQSEAHADLGDPAVAVFTDLRVAPSVVVPAAEALTDTRRLMQLAGVRMAFVIGSGSAVIGMVTLADLSGERPMRVAGSRMLAQKDLSVGDVMTPAAQWATLAMERVARAHVGDIVATFVSTGQRYLIVTEAEAASGADNPPRTQLRGLFSANRVERALGSTIAEELRSRSFADLATALAHH